MLPRSMFHKPACNYLIPSPQRPKQLLVEKIAQAVSCKGTSQLKRGTKDPSLKTEMDWRLLARGPEKGVSFGIPAASGPSRWLPPCFLPTPENFPSFFSFFYRLFVGSIVRRVRYFLHPPPFFQQGLRKEELKGLRMKGAGRLKTGSRPEVIVIKRERIEGRKEAFVQPSGSLSNWIGRFLEAWRLNGRLKLAKFKKWFQDEVLCGGKSIYETSAWKN